MQESKYKIKIVCGFRKDQEFTIDANEAHKAYYLFNNPDKRGTFNNGLALKGSDIQRIEPDYNSTMGWNPNHLLTSDDWTELNIGGTANKLRNIMALAKEVAKANKLEDLTQPLIKLKGKYITLPERTAGKYAQQISIKPVDNFLDTSKE